MHKTLVTLTGPSGSGKTALQTELCGTGKYTRLVSTTTRPMRAGETDGVDYHFVTMSKFQQLSVDRQFVQTASFQGNFYGTQIKDLETALLTGAIPLTVVEPTGVDQFRIYCNREGWKYISVFVQSEFPILVERYLSRLREEDLSNPTRLKYHSTRIAAIHNEHQNWPEEKMYNLKILNSVQDVELLKELASHLDVEINKKGLEDDQSRDEAGRRKGSYHPGIHM